MNRLENRKVREPSLFLSAPKLTALRDELIALQAALRSIQPHADPASLRLIKQFHAQLSTTSAVLKLTGSAGAGVSTLGRLLAGKKGDEPRRTPHPAGIPSESTSRGQAAPYAGNVLPVRMSETTSGQFASTTPTGAPSAMTPNRITLIVLRADLLCRATDFSLVRLLREQSKEPMILFINRVDCLDDPAFDISTIRGMIMELIKRHRPNGSSPILIFGSLAWAEAAQSGQLAALPESSKKALLSLAEVAEVEGDDHAPSFVWKLSGMSALMDAIGLALEESPLRRLLAKIRRHLQSALAEDHQAVSTSLHSDLAIQLSIAEVTQQSEALSKRLMAEMDRQIAQTVDQVRDRMSRVGSDYAATALIEMQRSLDRLDAPAHFDVDPFRVRLQLRSASLGFAQSCRALTDRMLRRAARDFANLSRNLLGSETGLGAPETALGTFLSVRAPDLHNPAPGLPDGPWSWRPRKNQSRAELVRQFTSHMNMKVAALLREADDRQIAAPTLAMRQRLGEVLQQQSEALIAHASRGDAGLKHPMTAPMVQELSFHSRAVCRPLNSGQGSAEKLGAPGY